MAVAAPQVPSIQLECFSLEYHYIHWRPHDRKDSLSLKVVLIENLSRPDWFAGRETGKFLLPSANGEQVDTIADPWIRVYGRFQALDWTGLMEGLSRKKLFLHLCVKCPSHCKSCRRAGCTGTATALMWRMACLCFCSLFGCCTMHSDPGRMGKGLRRAHPEKLKANSYVGPTPTEGGVPLVWSLCLNLFLDYSNARSMFDRFYEILRISFFFWHLILFREIKRGKGFLR